MSKNKWASGDWVRWRKDQMCGKAEAAVSLESACKSRQRCVCVDVIYSCLKVLILTAAGSPKATSQSHSCSFAACRQERSCRYSV